ncbi:hypothetical protein [Nocardioides sp.]|uniref:hypothetical protein n=1 Tax=Nocardioides sp. TaxID=35761 RepID=UPI003527C5D4
MAGQRSAVHRYNHSQSYVDLVLRIARAYAHGDYTSVPGTSPASMPTTTQTRPTETVVPPAAPADPPKQPQAEQVTPDPDGGKPSGTPPPLVDPVPTTDDPGGDPTSTEPEPADPTPSDDPTPSGEPEPSGDATPAGEATPAADTGSAAPAPITPASAAALCVEVGYVDDPDVADEPYDACLALLLGDPPEIGLPTKGELLARLEAEGIPLP